MVFYLLAHGLQKTDYLIAVFPMLIKMLKTDFQFSLHSKYFSSPLKKKVFTYLNKFWTLFYELKTQQQEAQFN